MSPSHPKDNNYIQYSVPDEYFFMNDQTSKLDSNVCLRLNSTIRSPLLSFLSLSLPPCRAACVSACLLLPLNRADEDESSRGSLRPPPPSWRLGRSFGKLANTALRSQHPESWTARRKPFDRRGSTAAAVVDNGGGVGGGGGMKKKEGSIRERSQGMRPATFCARLASQCRVGSNKDRGKWHLKIKM